MSTICNVVIHGKENERIFLGRLNGTPEEVIDNFFIENVRSYKKPFTIAGDLIKFRDYNLTGDIHPCSEYVYLVNLKAGNVRAFHVCHHHLSHVGGSIGLGGFRERNGIDSCRRKIQ